MLRQAARPSRAAGQCNGSWRYWGPIDAACRTVCLFALVLSPLLSLASSDVSAQDVPRETVQADVSSRSVSVTSSFSGTQIIVFGAVNNSRQLSPESGYYDIVITVEGAPTRLAVHKKSNFGIWLNSASISFDSVPSYYAIVSTRPLDDIADPAVLRDNEIGFEHIRMTPVVGSESGVTTQDADDFKSAVIRIKRREHLYIDEQFGVAFIGSNLFRGTFDLPANMPVGQLQTRVHLFREGRLLHTFTSRVTLEREGLERFLHTFAFRQPILYGASMLCCALIIGFLAYWLGDRR